MNIEELKRELQLTLGQTPVAELCVQLVDALLTMDTAHGRMLTFTSLQKMLGRAEIDTPLVLAVQFLTSSRYALLTAHGQLIDDDGEEYPLDAEGFSMVLKTGTVVHPVSGEVLPEAKDKVMPFFALSLPDDLELPTR